MKRLVCCLMLCLGIASANAQLRITPEVGVAILKTNMLHSNALAAPRLGVGVDYYFNGQDKGWGIGTGLYFYQKKESSSAAELYLTEDNKLINAPLIKGYEDYIKDAMAQGKLNQFDYMEFDMRRDYLQLPVLLTYQWKIAEQYAVSVAAGPYVAVGVGGKHEIRESILEVDKKEPVFTEKSISPYDLWGYSRFDVGFSSRLSVSANHLLFNLRYETNLNRRNEMGCDNLISLGVGYRF